MKRVMWALPTPDVDVIEDLPPSAVEVQDPDIDIEIDEGNETEDDEDWPIFVLDDATSEGQTLSLRADHDGMQAAGLIGGCSAPERGIVELYRQRDPREVIPCYV